LDNSILKKKKNLKEAVSLLSEYAKTFYSSENMFLRDRNMSFFLDDRFIEIFTSLAEDGKEKGRLWRMHVFLWAFMNALKIPGDIIECGVYRGFSCAVAVRYTNFESNLKKLFLFDTWDGIPDDQLDKNRKQIEKYKDPKNLEKVSQRFENYPNVFIVKGKVPEVFDEIVLPDKISFLHLDMNTSIAEIAALDILFERIQPGGVCLLDDYGLLLAREQMLAERAWFLARGYHVLELPTSQALVIRVN